MPFSAVDIIVLSLLGVCGIGGAIALLAALARTWTANRHGDEALQRADVLTREGKIDDAVLAVGRLPGAVSTVLLAGLSASDETEAERAMANAADSERRRLSASIRLLDAVAGIALVLPMAALALSRFTGDDPASPDDLEGRLLLLALGIGIAIFAVLGRFWILARVRRIVVEMEKGAAVVYNTAR